MPGELLDPRKPSKLWPVAFQDRTHRRYYNTSVNRLMSQLADGPEAAAGWMCPRAGNRASHPNIRFKFANAPDP